MRVLVDSDEDVEPGMIGSTLACTFGQTWWNRMVAGGKAGLAAMIATVEEARDREKPTLQ
jgi:hypothetical protein